MSKQLQLFEGQGGPAPKKKAKTIDDFRDYDGFVDKFKSKKTTDDCYTPPKVYDAVLRFVGTLTDLTDRPIVRPFYPGGDYENHDYPDGCIVVDNPPFSIYAKIVRFYLARGIDFFLFAPHLTAFVANADCTFIITNIGITYENGAVVNTSFTTSLCPDLRIWLCPELKEAIEEAQKVEKSVLSKNTYPMEVVSSSTLGRIIHRNIPLKILKSDCVFVSNLDALRAKKKSVFGNAFLLSERAAAERAAAERAAAEQAAAERAAAERAAGCTVKLSERELRIVRAMKEERKEETE